MSLPPKVGLNTLFQLLGKLVSAFSTFLILSLVARRFGEAGTGEFTLVLSFVALFYLITDFGFNAIVVKKMVGEKKRASFYFQNLLGLRLVWSTTLTFLAVLSALFLPYSRIFKIGVFLSCLTIVAQGIFTSANAFFQSRLRYDQSVLASSLGRLTTVFLVYLLIVKKVSLVFLLSTYVVGGGVMATTALFVIRRSLFVIHPAFDLNFWRSLFLSTLPLSLTLLVGLLHFKIDTFVLAYFRPISEVGIYNIAYKIFENILVFPVFFVNSLYPLLIKNHTRSLEKLRATVKKAGLFLFFVSLLAFLILVALAPWIIGILTGRGFEGSILALRILALSLPAFFTTALLMWVLITLGQPWLLFRIYLVAMILDLILNLIFVPKFGFLAAAITTGATEGLVLILEGYFVLKFLNRS